MPSVLFIFSSVSHTLTGGDTGFSIPEVAHPYYVLAPFCDITFASPHGPNPPIDAKSMEIFIVNPECATLCRDKDVGHRLRQAKRLQDIDPQQYDALLYVGGYGSCVDLPNDAFSIAIASSMYRSGKIVGALCHGLAAFVNMTDQSGMSAFRGKNFTGFFNTEEEPVNAIEAFKASLVNAGGVYHSADERYAPKVVIDGNLIMGQNMSSARPLALEMLARLRIRAAKGMN